MPLENRDGRPKRKRGGSCAVMRWLVLPGLLIAAAMFTACAPKPPPPPQGYYGETLPVEQVVQLINERAAALPTLFARHYVEANIYNPERKRFNFINAGGDLFVHKPQDFLLRGRKDVVGPVFEIGSTDERYWMTVYEGDETMWWGWYRNVGKPCVQGMPIRPDAVGEVLGINTIGPNLREAPVPTMRFNNDLDVYMFVWNVPLENRWYAEKEIWYDRRTLLPVKVLLFDRDGRVVLRANLTQHEPVEVPGLPQEQWPRVATVYDLFFPETNSRMNLRLNELALTTRTGQPQPGTIRFPEDPGVPEVIQIDAECE